MASRYDTYFLGQNVSTAKGKLMYDIKNHVVYGAELSEIIDNLEKNGLLEEKPFTKKTQSQWTNEYARFLAARFAAGYFSRDYLFHCAEVAEYLDKKRKRAKALLACGIVGLVVVCLIIAFCRT